MLPITIQKKGKINYANLSGASLMPGAAVRSDQQGIAQLDWIPSDLSKNGFFFNPRKRNTIVPTMPASIRPRKSGRWWPVSQADHH